MTENLRLKFAVKLCCFALFHEILKNYVKLKASCAKLKVIRNECKYCNCCVPIAILQQWLPYCSLWIVVVMATILSRNATKGICATDFFFSLSLSFSYQISMQWFSNNWIMRSISDLLLRKMWNETCDLISVHRFRSSVGIVVALHFSIKLKFMNSSFFSSVCRRSLFVPYSFCCVCVKLIRWYYGWARQRTANNILFVWHYLLLLSNSTLVILNTTQKETFCGLILCRFLHWIEHPYVIPIELLYRLRCSCLARWEFYRLVTEYSILRVKLWQTPTIIIIEFSLCGRTGSILSSAFRNDVATKLPQIWILRCKQFIWSVIFFPFHFLDFRSDRSESLGLGL